MRTLGIDYGTKRIGLAVSDETKTFARELTILSPKEFWQKIRQIIDEHQITQIVLGWPFSLKGEMTEKTKEAEEFKEKLEKFVEIKIEIMDERFTTSMAKKMPGGRRNVDSLAAQILLQGWLDKAASD